MWELHILHSSFQVSPLESLCMYKQERCLFAIISILSEKAVASSRDDVPKSSPSDKNKLIKQKGSVGQLKWAQKDVLGDFSGGPVVKNLPSKTGARFLVRKLRSHMPQDNYRACTLTALVLQWRPSAGKKKKKIDVSVGRLRCKSVSDHLPDKLVSFSEYWLPPLQNETLLPTWYGKVPYDS